MTVTTGTDRTATAADPREVIAAVLLVVEDEVLIRMAVADAFRAGGFTVIEAASGDEALSILDGSHAVQAIFSDVQMPGSLNGLALGDLVRDAFPGIALILTSGSPEAAGLALARGIPFIPKPYDAADVCRAMQDMLGQADD